MTQSKKGKWRDRTIEKLNRAQTPTVFLGDEQLQSGIESSDQPQFDVFQVKLKGKDDQPIILSGNTLNVELQVSLLKAVDQLLEIRGFGSGSRKAGFPLISNKGKPQVVLNFYEKDEDVEEGYEPLEGHLSFRIDASEDWTNEKNNLSAADIEKFSKKIKDEFVLPTPYKWHKGKDTVSYNNKKEGLLTWGYFYNKPEGQEIFKKLCKVAGITYEPWKLRYTEVEQANVAYPTIPPKRNVFGQEVKGIRKRGVGYVYFENAYLYLSTFKKPILLADHNGVVFNSADFDINSYVNSNV
ncbi:MAG TPA: hypothetical protein V6D21_13090 [Candidatus Obscuribacterales bacterium]